MHGDESGRGGPKFELRAFHEERRPAKLFTPGEEQRVRVTRRRPTEEVRETNKMTEKILKVPCPAKIPFPSVF